MSRRHLFAATAMFSLAGLCPAGGAFASDLSPHELQSDLTPMELPAVSGINAKLDAFGGGYEDGGIGGASGALSIPLGFRYGTQIDLLAASLDGEFLGSVSDHLFWRDPGIGLLGLYGSYAHYEGFGGVDEYHAAVEGELYRGNITLRAMVGVEGGDADTVTEGGATFNYDIDTRFFDKLDVVYYPTPDLQLFVGHRYTGGIHAVAAGAEYLWHSGDGRAASTFVEGRLGEDDSEAIWAGVRLYFSPADKSLIRRHREDDPNLWEPGTHLGISAKLGGTQREEAPVVDPCLPPKGQASLNRGQPQPAPVGCCARRSGFQAAC